MAETRKGTRFAVVLESVEATIVAPSSASEYLSIREGVSLSPNFDVLESDEIKASIGASASITGLENPEASISRYLKHSGVEATPPEDNLLLRAVFGSEATRATERPTVAGSTAGTASVRAAINVGGGFGAEFQRGDALLLKDSSNGYSIRPVYSVATDTLSLGFNLTAAPAAAVNLGRNTVFRPTNSGHPTLSVWDYLGNGGLVQAISGMRVSEFGMSWTAGELIETTYSMAGVKFFYNPLEVLAADRFIDFTDDDGTFAASVVAKVYRHPKELAVALAQAMNDTASTQTYTVTYSDTTGKFNIKGTGTLLSLLFLSGANNANQIDNVLGYSHTDKTGTGATTGYTSQNSISAPGGALGSGLASPQTPSLDASDPLVAKSNEFMIGDFNDFGCTGAQSMDLTISDEVVNILDVCSDSGKSGTQIVGRTVELNATLTLSRFEVEKFRRYAESVDTSILFNFGPKSGGNWVAGKSGCLYLPTVKISAFEVTEGDNLATIDLTATAFVDSSGNGEVYLNFV